MNKKPVLAEVAPGGVSPASISSRRMSYAGFSESGLLIVLLIGAAFAGLALLLVFTKRPWVDEAWFTGPALDLVTRGRFGTLLLDPAGSHLRIYKSSAVLQGINQ